MSLWEEIQYDPWKQIIVGANVPLWKYNNGVPIAVASACIIDYASCRFLLSIAHASIAVSEWVLEISSAFQDVNGEWFTKLQPVEMNFLTQFNFIPDTFGFTEPNIVDFTYKKIPSDLESYHVIGFYGNKRLGAYRTIFKPNFNIKPSFEKKYGFYGKIKFNGTKGRQILFEEKIEDELKYIGEKGEHLIFQLPHKYGSHANYIGCSGAPIIDEDNNLIALVSYGERSTNCIYGININKYRAALEIESNPLI